jgi:hypothetical protein
MSRRVSHTAGLRLSAFGLAVWALAGCASLSEAECLSGDWRVIGFQDGAEGQPPDRVGEHSQACSRYGVAPSLDLWRRGYEDGLVSYCTRATGFRVGVTGSTYHGVCAGAAANEFLVAFRDGRSVFDVRQALGQAQSDLGSVSSDIRRAREDRDRARERAGRKDLPAEEREELLDDIERLSERIGDLERQRRDIDRAVERIQSDAWSVESRMQSFYPEWSGY